MSRRPVYAAAAVLLVAALVGGWLAWSSHTAGQVEVTWAAGSPDCEGTTVRRPSSGRPVILAEDDMRCVITVEVHNGSGRSVHLDHAVAPYVGPRTGAVVTAEDATSAGLLSDGGHLDHLVDLDHDLGPGGTTTFEIAVVLHPRGCNQGVTSWVEAWPVVTVDVLGRQHDRHGDTDFGWYREGSTPGCFRR